MSKSGMSNDFAKFAAKTTKGAYDEARKGERMGRGLPYAVGTKGTAVVSAIVGETTKPDDDGVKFPRCRVEMKIETPEPLRGKPLSGSGLMQTIKDGRNPEKWSAEMAWGAWLGILESCGCPEELTKGYSDYQQVVDWFDEAPRRVHYEVQENNWTNAQGKEVQGKQVSVSPFIDESTLSTAEGTPQPDDPEATYVTYRGTKHKVVGEDGDKLVLESSTSGNMRKVAKDQVEQLV